MMEHEMEEEKMNLCSEEQKKLLCHTTPKPRKGGLRTMPFIIVTESFESLASTGLLGNMIFYLTREYHMEPTSGSTILLLWSAFSSYLSIFGAVLSDSYLGRFRAILLGSISSFLGMTLLWLTATIPELRPSPCDQFSYSCDSPTAAQLAVLFSSMGLISIGSGCIKPCSTAFGADQLNNEENPDNERVLQSFFNWYYATSGISTVLALTVIVYIQDHLGWVVGLGVPAILMLFSVLMFLLGSSLYVKVKPSESLFTGFVQVIVVAFKNRNINLPPSNDDGWYGQCHENGQLLAPTKNLRFLNKACVITDCTGDLNHEERVSNPWTICSVEKVESLKAFLRVLPMWSASIMLAMTIGQNAFSTLQVKTMDRHITPNFEVPAGSFGLVMVVTLIAWVAFYDRVMVPILAKCTGKPGGLSPKTRMGVGLLLGCVAAGLSGITESMRRGKAIEEGFEDDPDGAVDMSAMWLLPQYALHGLADAFNLIGQIEFYYTQFPKSMSSIGMALFTFGMAMASLLSSVLVNVVDSVTSKGGKVSWLSKNLNKGHLDYYYWLLGFLSLVNFVYFLVCCRACRPEEDKVDEEEKSDYRNLPSA